MLWHQPRTFPGKFFQKKISTSWQKIKKWWQRSFSSFFLKLASKMHFHCRALKLEDEFSSSVLIYTIHFSSASYTCLSIQCIDILTHNLILWVRNKVRHSGHFFYKVMERRYTSLRTVFKYCVLQTKTLATLSCDVTRHHNEEQWSALVYKY